MPNQTRRKKRKYSSIKSAILFSVVVIAVLLLIYNLLSGSSNENFHQVNCFVPYQKWIPNSSCTNAILKNNTSNTTFTVTFSLGSINKDNVLTPGLNITNISFIWAPNVYIEPSPLGNGGISLSPMCPLPDSNSVTSGFSCSTPNFMTYAEAENTVQTFTFKNYTNRHINTVTIFMEYTGKGYGYVGYNGYDVPANQSYYTFPFAVVILPGGTSGS